MKKLLFVILIITLPVIAFFQYKKYERFNPPVNYELIVNEEIDLNYHNYALVEEYFAKVVDISAYARNQWRNEGVDVRFPAQNSETELNIARYYTELISRTKWLETRLLQSAKWKVAGYDNEQIKRIESGISPQDLKWLGQKEQFLSIILGSRGEHVWNVQKRLDSLGYDHTLDGVFGTATQNALLSFQQDKNLYPSGIIDETTFNAIFIK